MLRSLRRESVSEISERSELEAGILAQIRNSERNAVNAFVCGAVKANASQK